LLEATSERAAQDACAKLRAAGFDSRLWYGLGLHREPYFRDAARDPLPQVEALAPRLIGLPVAADLAEAVVERIVAVVAAALRQP
jgi:dTDP-4-amino-4,6-dideoxygalactose transaminase